MTYTITLTDNNFYTITDFGGSTLSTANHLWVITAEMGFKRSRQNGTVRYEFGNPAKWNGLYRVNELKG